MTRELTKETPSTTMPHSDRYILEVTECHCGEFRLELRADAPFHSAEEARLAARRLLSTETTVCIYQVDGGLFGRIRSSRRRERRVLRGEVPALSATI